MVNVEDFLMHYGVLGMHWGVRKKKESPSLNPSRPRGVKELEAYSQRPEVAARLALQVGGNKEFKGLTSAQKAALIAGGVGAAGLAAFILSRGKLKLSSLPTGIPSILEPGNYKAFKFSLDYINKAKVFTQPISKKTFDLIDDVDVRIPKGTVFKRVTSNPNEDLGSRLYTSFKDADHLRYQAIYPAALRKRTGIENLHISELHQIEDIVSPSHKKRIQMFKEVIDENPPIKEYYNSLHSIFNRGTPTTEELALSYYNGFAQQLVADSQATRAYFKKVQDSGYNALVDDNDYKMLADLPMILLDAGKTTGTRVSTELTKEMEILAKRQLEKVIGV